MSTKMNERPTKIEQLQLSELTPWDKNPRKHGKSIDELVKSIHKNGFTNPIIIDQTGRIIAGHGRYQAAKRLNLPSVPCIRLEVTEAQYLELVISDNKIAELSKWDNKKLQDILTSLEGIEIEPPPGFTLEDIDKVFGHKHEDVSATDEADFGDAGAMSTADDKALIKRKTFLLTRKEYNYATDKLKAIKNEHGLDTEAEAFLIALKPYKGLAKVKKAKQESEE